MSSYFQPRDDGTIKVSDVGAEAPDLDKLSAPALLTLAGALTAFVATHTEPSEIPQKMTDYYNYCMRLERLRDQMTQKVLHEGSSIPASLLDADGQSSGQELADQSIQQFDRLINRYRTELGKLHHLLTMEGDVFTFRDTRGGATVRVVDKTMRSKEDLERRVNTPDSINMLRSDDAARHASFAEDYCYMEDDLYALFMANGDLLQHTEALRNQRVGQLTSGRSSSFAASGQAGFNPMVKVRQDGMQRLRTAWRDAYTRSQNTLGGPHTVTGSEMTLRGTR